MILIIIINIINLKININIVVKVGDKFFILIYNVFGVFVFMFLR